jgi:hypothetical protein
MRLVARFLLLGAVFVAGVLVIVVFAKPDLPGFLLASGVGTVLIAVTDRLMLSRFLGRPTSDLPSRDIRER